MTTELSGIKNQGELNQLIIQKKIRPVWSNVYVGKQRYQVVEIEGKCHSVGGGFGDNCYWCYPADKPMTFETLVEFGGHVLCWGITTEQTNYVKTKWDQTEINKGNSTWITLNGQKLLSIGGSTEYALPKAQTIIIELSEGVINFTDYDWRDQLVGRKIYYRDQPAIIKSVCTNDLDLIIVPDGIPSFTPPGWLVREEDFSLRDWEIEGGQSIKTRLLSPNIDWFRD